MPKYVTLEDIQGADTPDLKWKMGGSDHVVSLAELGPTVQPIPEPQAPIANETITRKVLDALLPPSPEDVASANLWGENGAGPPAHGLRGVLEETMVKPSERFGGAIKDLTSGLSEPVLSPAMGAAKQLGTNDITGPMVDEIGTWLNKKGLNPEGSTLAQFASGIPGTLAETAGDFTGSLVADAPAQMALSGVGEGMAAIGAYPKVAAGLEKVAPKLFYRGGQLPASKVAGNALDIGKLQNAEDATSLFNRVFTNPGGKPLGQSDYELMGALMEDKNSRNLLSQLPTQTEAGLPMEGNAIRDMLAKGMVGPEQVPALMGQSQDITRIPENLKSSMWWNYKHNDLPGLIKTRGINPAIEEALYHDMTMPVATHAKIADELSKVFFAAGGPKKGLAQQLEEVGAASPDTFARFTDQYTPWIRGKVVQNLTTDTLEVMPNEVARTTGTTGKWQNKNYLKKRGEMTDEDRLNNAYLSPEKSISIRYMQEKATINNHKYFNTLAADPAVVRHPTTFQEVLRGEPTSNIQGWKEMPNDKAFGPLQGMMVRAPEANDILAAQKFQMGLPKAMKKWWSMWKFGKTVMSPKTHVRNFVSNAMLAHGAGLSPWRVDIYDQSAKELANGGKWLDEAKSVGAEWAFNAKGGSQIGEMFNFGKASNIYEAGFNSLPEKIMNNKAMKGLANAYQDSERLFKHAIYIYLRRNGVAADEAMSRASFGIINYDKMPYWLKELRSNPLGVPFASYTYGSIGPLSKALMEKPQIYAQYYIVGDAWNRMAAEAAGAKQEDVDKMEALSGGMAPVLLPTRDASGGLLTVDLNPAMPVGNLIPGRRSIGFGEEMKASGLPSFLGSGMGAIESTLLSNPILSEAVAQMTGVDPYFKNNFMEPTAGAVLNDARAQGFGSQVDKYGKDIMSEKHRAQLLHAARTIMPELLGGATTQNMYEAIKGKTNFLGDQTTPGDVGLSLISPVGNPRSLRSMDVSSKFSAKKFPGLVVGAKKKEAIREKGRFVTLDEVKSGKP